MNISISISPAFPGLFFCCLLNPCLPLLFLFYQNLLIFLRGCKWSLQRCKAKIDYFYTVRALLPEFFLNRDPFNDDIQKFLTKGVVYPLPKPLGEAGSRIFYYDYNNIDVDTMTLMNLFKLLMMSVELLLQEDDNLIISGMVLLVDSE